METPAWKLHVLARNLIFWADCPHRQYKVGYFIKPFNPAWFVDAQIWPVAHPIQEPVLRELVFLLLKRLSGWSLWRLEVARIAGLLEMLSPADQHCLLQILKDWYD